MSFCTSSDFLKSSSFRIVLEKPEAAIEFFVQEAILPGWQIGELNVAWMAQNQQRPGDEIVWNQLNMTVLCDEALEAWKACHRYCLRIKNPETGELGGPEETFDGKLIILTNKNNLSHEITFHDAWIQNVSDLQFSNTTSEDEPMTFTMDIQYDYYTIE
jgi:hypothetical protein